MGTNATHTAAAMERIAQPRGAELERSLRRAKEYWLRIQPYIKDRPLRGAGMYVAADAHFRLRQAAGRAAGGNRAEQKRGIERLMEAFDKAFSTVTFEEIKASNTKSSGKLPLLPPMGQKRKNISDQEQREEPLSILAIREAVGRYLEEHTQRLTREEY